MKKTLRSLAIAALALPLIASAEITMTTVWMNGVADGTANPIPGLDAGWGKPTVSNPGTASVSRFAVGKDGKIITTNHKENSIVAWDGKSMTTVAKLAPVTVTSWDNNNNPTPADGRWPGTAVSTDDAGNIIFNYCFIQPKSVQEWGVITPDGKVSDITLSTPLADINNPKRIDIISHIVGDVTSAEGGIGYSVSKGSGNITMFHFKGDGKKVTSLTAKSSSEVTNLKEIGSKAQIETYQACPKYNTVAKLLQGTPQDNFYLAVGYVHPQTDGNIISFTEGMIANFNGTSFAPYMGIGNRGISAVGIVNIAGKQYFVRNYVANDNPMANILTGYKNVMQLGIFDENGNCVATWTESSFTNVNGAGTITVEPIDENSANIYIYVATGTPDTTTGTAAGCYAAMIKVENVLSKGTGTKDDPYIVATAADLCNMWSKMKENDQTYFIQTADIDMTGIENYVAPNGHSGAFACAIHYDGQNHVIKNFAPKDRVAGVGDKAYYCTSVFGVAQGTIKNLGIVDANITSTKFESGILAAFFGGSWAGSFPSSMENVFVTGKIVNTHENDQAADTKPTGGMIGQVAADVTLSNCYAQVEVEGKYNAAGIVALLGNTMTLNNCYVSATVKGATTNLVANGGTVVANNAVAFGTGAVPTGVTLYPAKSADGIKAVQKWAAFNAGNMFNGLPALNWQGGASSGIEDFEVETSDAPAVYYNLQGVEVKNPESGIYIVRRGNKVTKELIR